MCSKSTSMTQKVPVSSRLLGRTFFACNVVSGCYYKKQYYSCAWVMLLHEQCSRQQPLPDPILTKKENHFVQFCYEFSVPESILRYRMWNIFRLPKVNPLSVCPTNPHPQPTSLALGSAAAAVSQVDLLCTTPLKITWPLAKKINWNTAVYSGLCHSSPLF